MSHFLLPKEVILVLLIVMTSIESRAEGILQLWEHVIESNPTLKSSEHAVEQAKAQKDQAMAKLLPSMGVKGYYSFNSYNRNMEGGGFTLTGGTNTSYGGYMGSLQFTQALFDLPSFLTLQGADKQTQQQEQYALAQRMQVAYDLVDAYLNVLHAEDQIRQLKGEIDASRTQLARLRKMHEQQMAKVTDLYEVEAYAQSLETSEIEAEHEKAIATEKLREISGVLVQHPEVLRQVDFPELKRNADEWVQEALSSNPLLLSLQYGAESAQQMINSAQAQHLPTASFSAQETVANTITNNLQVTPYNIGSLYLNVNIPLYQGGGVEAGVREQAQKYSMTREKIEETRRAIEKDTRTAWFNVVSGRSRIESSLKEVKFREKAKTAQETSYHSGVTTIVDLLDAHRRLLKGQTDFYKARYDFVRSLIRLRLNSGSLADIDLEVISPWFGPTDDSAMNDVSVPKTIYEKGLHAKTPSSELVE